MSGNSAQNKNSTRGMFNHFFHSEVSGSVVLLFCAVAALIWANSPWGQQYFDLLHTYIGISWGEAKFKLSLQHWINDAVMVVFFFVVGLEIKREVCVGQLSSIRQAILPIAAAVGGMVVPALFYVLVNTGGEGQSGWGIPMATDIAFALGILALFGTRAPIGLKVFLTALAIADDIGAVLVIALFYSEQIRWVALLIAALFLGVILLFSYMRVRSPIIYLLPVVGVWIAVFVSGIHATVAGILVALLVPVRARIEPEWFLQQSRETLDGLNDMKLTKDSMVKDHSQLEKLDDMYYLVTDMTPPGISLEHYFHPIQAFLILPLFALFNAGVPFDPSLLGIPPEKVVLGIILGLFVGKPLGITIFSWLAIKSGIASLPEGVTWSHIVGVGFLAGVGFTMSIFISDLAFSNRALVSEAKIGILVASLLSGVVGYLILNKTLKR